MYTYLKSTNRVRKKRAMRVRKKITGEALKPRLSVFRSNKHVGAQLIDDINGVTLVSVSTNAKSSNGTEFSSKSKVSAKHLGGLLASAAKEKNINHVIFDRGRYKYHGVIAELAQGAREAGLQF